MNILAVVYDNGSFLHYFPIGIASIVAVLKKEGYNVDIFNQDVYHYEEEKLTELLDSKKYDVVCIGTVAGYYPYRKILKLSEAVNKSKNRSKFDYVLGGHMVSAEPDYFLRKTQADYIIIGEGERTIIELLNKSVKTTDILGLAYRIGDSCFINPPRPLITDLDTLPRINYEMFPIDYYRLQRMPNIGTTEFSLSIITGRGCSFKCLSGKTKIDTLEYGIQEIGNLVGKKVKVLTRNPKTYKLEYGETNEIILTQKQADVVRVHFDDKTFIDCTPDHKFLTFKNGNQFSVLTETEKEAIKLKKGDSVRAIKYRKNAFGYLDVLQGRNDSKKYHRLKMEGKIGRKLKKNEIVHHKDNNKLNNDINNLILTNIKEHYIFHSKEFSDRMKKNNPMFNKKIRDKQNKSLLASIKRKDYIPFLSTKKGRKIIRKIALKRALSKNNPLRKLKGKTWEEFYGKDVAKKKKENLSLKMKGNKYYKFREINHKISKVEKLNKKEDVFCMEVPGYNWFFANNVLVHNCNFCYRLMPGLRMRSIGAIIDEIKYLKNKYNITYFDFADDLTMESKKRCFEMCEAFLKEGLEIKWRCEGRLNFVDKEVLDIMKKAGCVFINYGIESLDNTVLKNMRKALTDEIIIRGVEATLRANISPGLNIIFGNIGDNEETLKKSVDFLLKYDDCSQIRSIRPVSPYPGCELYEIAKQRGLIKDAKDFYENKHTNSDLLTVNFTELSDNKFYDILYRANMSLLKNYSSKKNKDIKKQLIDLYKYKNTNFRGWRHT